MDPLRVLHITPWFPNPTNHIEGIFIKKHIQALNEFCENDVLHVASHLNISENVQGEVDGIHFQRKSFKFFSERWIIKEKVIARHLNKWLKKNANRYDHINFYIAYPNAVDIKKFKTKFPKHTFSITEQWSAYHQEFKLQKGTKGRNRIEQIFQHKTPLFTVSSALGNDINNFISPQKTSFTVIPNIVDTSTFSHESNEKATTFTFCSINTWSELKNPFVLMKAIAKLKKDGVNAQLILAGEGQLSTKMKEFVANHKLNDAIQIRGRIPSNEVAQILQESHVYCQSSEYETFSAICIEALACGTPVVAHKVGGMVDFVDKENGLLVPSLEVEDWKNAMLSIMKSYQQFDRTTISTNARNRFNANVVGELFYNEILKLKN